MLALETPFGRPLSPLWTPPSANRSTSYEQYLLCPSPFAFVLADAPVDGVGHDITSWSQWSVDQRPRRHELNVALPTAKGLDPALRAMIYPDRYVANSHDQHGAH